MQNLREGSPPCEKRSEGGCTTACNISLALCPEGPLFAPSTPYNAEPCWDFRMILQDPHTKTKYGLFPIVTFAGVLLKPYGARSATILLLIALPQISTLLLTCNARHSPWGLGIYYTTTLLQTSSVRSPHPPFPPPPPKRCTPQWPPPPQSV